MTSTLQSEYDAQAHRYQELCLEIVKQIDELLRGEHINLASPIEWRVKTWASILDKVERTQTQPKALADVSDLAGIRAIALFRRDIQPIQKTIEENFTVLHKEDTSTRLEENQFGYGSVHYEIEPPAHWHRIPDPTKIQWLEG